MLGINDQRLIIVAQHNNEITLPDKTSPSKCAINDYRKRNRVAVRPDRGCFDADMASYKALELLADTGQLLHSA
ncbi:hypothetical protein A1359_07890 [Methylomonas lenta]|uniref:Uncharacterized protein n=1 Tax=Methylomonas lenta TaxID=980561 RepID=A0A177NER3_9GAMM|nr:hypothetical protein A1359_07890 [Methylomonas lenta]